MKASGPFQPCLKEMPAMEWFLIRWYLQRVGSKLWKFDIVNVDLATREGR